MCGHFVGKNNVPRGNLPNVNTVHLGALEPRHRCCIRKTRSTNVPATTKTLSNGSTFPKRKPLPPGESGACLLVLSIRVQYGVPNPAFLLINFVSMYFASEDDACAVIPSLQRQVHGISRGIQQANVEDSSQSLHIEAEGREWKS